MLTRADARSRGLWITSQQVSLTFFVHSPNPSDQGPGSNVKAMSTSEQSSAESASPAADAAPVSDQLVEANAAYADAFTDPGLTARPVRKVAILACMDARLDLHRALGLELGDCHTLRNAGGVVTDDVIRSLTISQRALGTRSVFLIHHTTCGMESIDESFRTELEREVGQRPQWAVEAWEDAEQDMRQSIERVRTSPFLLYKDDVRGFIFDVATGRLREVKPA